MPEFDKVAGLRPFTEHVFFTELAWTNRKITVPEFNKVAGLRPFTEHVFLQNLSNFGDGSKYN